MPASNEFPRLELETPSTNRSEDSDTMLQEKQEHSVDSEALRHRLRVETSRGPDFRYDVGRPSPSQTREEENRLQDELFMEKAEQIATSDSNTLETKNSTQLNRSRSRARDPVDDFDANTNPLHERAAIYKPPDHPTTNVAKFFKYIHQSSFIIRYFTYIVPVFVLLLIPLLMGAFLPAGKDASVGGVQLLWFGVWLEIVWLTLWAGRIVAKLIPVPLGLIASLFTNNAKKWRDLGKELELPATLFLWWLGVEVSFLPTMINHHVDGNRASQDWEVIVNKIIISIFVGATLNFLEKIIIQLIAISFHLRTYADRIEINKFQIGSLTKLYIFSKAKIQMEDAEFEEKPSGGPSGARTPGQMAQQAQEVIGKAFAKVGDVAGTVAGDFTGKAVTKSHHPDQVVLTLLHSTAGSQVLARRLYRTFVRDGYENVSSEDLKAAFDNDDEAEAAFSMFDKDMNGDISMEELEAVCVEIGRERKSITASLKDLDSVVAKLDDVLFFVVCIITLLVLVSLISTSAAGVLTSAGSAVLALSWLFSATAQEFLQSCIFVFIKHPFDVGDRVTIYGNTGPKLTGDDYFVKEISLLYTEFKKMEGHVVQAPNSYLNTLFILNMRRSGGLAEAVPIVIRFGTTLDQIETLREQLLGFVKSEKREYQGNIITELREVTEAYSITLNVVFFYKSNWQNELLRLQRRNKFICAMMMAMQELNIEGPRRNQAGWRAEIPYFMQAPVGAPPVYSAQNNDPADPSISHAATDSTPTQSNIPRHASVLRNRAPSTGQLRRVRTESLSQMAKRVDFSLGMRGMSSGAELGDVYEDRETSNYEDIIRETNRREQERRESIARSASRDAGSRAPASPIMTGGLVRRPTALAHRASISSQATHRNRFLDRFGRTQRSMDLPRDSLAEEGHAGPIDARSGYVGSNAVRTDSPVFHREPSAMSPIRPVTSQTEDFELSHQRRT